MRYSQLFLPTVKEVPAEAEIPSHQLMIRAGYFRRLASGTYTYLPLGWRSILKIIAIVREEMNAADAQEISMPVLQPMELWRKTGRDKVFEDIMNTFEDRHGRTNTLAPTAEEVVTQLVSEEISSYRQLPVNLYQINTKFRDEFRPRFGALRSREFLMKDAYSFDADVAGLDEAYQKMRKAYCRIFDRCGLTYVTVEADSGGMGGTDTEEFMVPSPAGEDVILSSDAGNYAANVEKAQTGPREHDFSGEPTGELETVPTPDMKSIEDVGAFMKVKPKHLLKTLLCRRKDGWVVAVVRGDHELNINKLSEAVGEPLELADETLRDESGFVIGFAGPHAVVGRDDVLLVIDPDAAQAQFWATGANRQDHHVKHFHWQRDVLEPLGADAETRVRVADIRNAVDGDPSPRGDGGTLHESRGIEVGHIFKLGTKYSEMLGATFLDENGQTHPCIMGCYGIGINRILAAAIEVGHDDDGILLHPNIAPFEVLLVQLNTDNETVTRKAEAIYQALRDRGVDVLLDDREVRPGVKFKDADLIGIPLRVVIAERGLKEGCVEMKRRSGKQADMVPEDKAVEEILHALGELRESKE